MSIVHSEGVGTFADTIQFSVHTHDNSADCISLGAETKGSSARFYFTPAQARALAKALIRSADAANPERTV